MPHSNGAVGPPSAGDYEWQPYSRRPLVIGHGYGIKFARVMLHEMRWREVPRQWPLRIAAGCAVLLLHLVILAMLALARPAGNGSVSGAARSSAVAVRLINRPATPAPPPPVELPQRPAAPAARPARRAVKPAPVAAMPPVPQPARTRPDVTLEPPTPQVSVTLPPAPPPSRVTPSAVAAPPIAVPAPPRVIAEVSRQPIAVPEPQAITVVPAKAVAPSVEPIRTPPATPRISLTTPPLDVNAAAAVQPVAPARVEAAPPPLPQIQTAQPSKQVTLAPSAAPSISVPSPTPQAVAALPVPAPELPPVPAVAAAPAMPLPRADMTPEQVPQAAASVAVEAPAAVVASVPQPAARQAPATTPRTAAPAAATSSWALAHDRLKTPMAAAGPPGALAPHSAQGEGTVKRVPQGNSDVMTRGTDRLGYTPTIFERDWAPANESILDTFLRHFIEKLSVEHTFHLAPGIRVRCVLGPVAVFLVCGGGDAPRPKAAKSNDPRLNMAPARQLAPGIEAPAPAHPATVRTLQLNGPVQCEVAKVAGSPPPPGCPGAPAPAASTLLH